MRTVSISQLWGRAWDLFKVNWLLLLGLLVLSIIVSFIPYIGGLITMILLSPALVRAGYLVARKGQSSSREAFGDLGSLLMIFVYNLILGLILLPILAILIGLGYVLMMGSVYTKEKVVILIVAGLIILFILNLFGWAGPYAILSGRAGIFSAIEQSFSLTTQNFGKVFVAFLSLIGLAILGALLCGAGLLVVILVWHVFMPLLYFALTDEEGASHA